MTLFLDPIETPQRWQGSNVFFLHNWRCAGTSMTSLLASNIGEDYVKVGHPFSTWGWPLPYSSDRPQITTLRQVREGLRPGCVVGGHLFSGLECLLGGRWDLWMNARDPVERVCSGLLRFHSRALQKANPSADLMEKTAPLSSKADVEAVLNGPLKREVNGLSRRLAGLALAEQVNLSEETHLEKVDFLEAAHAPERLATMARTQLNQLKLLIIPEAFQASVLCMEAAYQLPPVINPFSDLRHNPIQLGGASESQRQLINSLKPALKQAMAVDVQLWTQLRQIFKTQVQRYGISKASVKVRELIHQEALLNSQWLAEPGLTADKLMKGFAGRIAQRAVSAGELGPELINTVCRWPRLNPDAAPEISERATKAWRHHTGAAV